MKINGKRLTHYTGSHKTLTFLGKKWFMLRLLLTSTFLIARNVYTKNTVDLSTDIAAETTVIFSVSEVSAIILFSRGYDLIRAVPLFHLKS